MATAKGLKRLRVIAARAGDSDDTRVVQALIGRLKAGMLADQAARQQSAQMDPDGDLILELPPCNDEAAWQERFGSMWLYYWISFGCWLP